MMKVIDPSCPLTEKLPMQPIIQEFDCVTIFFGDIIGFDELVADCSPTEVTLFQLRNITIYDLIPADRLYEPVLRKS